MSAANNENGRASRAEAHTRLHNDNDLFYTLSPALLVAIAKTTGYLTDPSLSEGERSALAKGAYYEFGVFKGFSLWFAQQYYRHAFKGGLQIYGFDSFEGLPSSAVDHHMNWKPGNYAESLDDVVRFLTQNGGDLETIKLFKGFFSDQLFRQIETENSLRPASVVVIDSDIYESCAEVLQFVHRHLVKNAILLFDDFNSFQSDNSHGERRALIEFESRHPGFRKQELFDFGRYGKAFRVTQVR